MGVTPPDPQNSSSIAYFWLGACAKIMYYAVLWHLFCGGKLINAIITPPIFVICISIAILGAGPGKFL